MKLPRQFFKPLAIGAPAPLRELPVRLERMIHFVPPHIEKIRAKVPELIREVDVVLGNLEDAIPADAKEAARAGFIEMAKLDYGATGLWTRINALNSPWALDDITEIVAAVGNKLDVMMLPKVEGPWDIHYLDQLLAQLEARHKVTRPILIHAILETAEGVKNVEAIAAASPRMHGMSLGPADLAASRAMKTTRVGGGHPDYVVLADAVAAVPPHAGAPASSVPPPAEARVAHGAPRARYQQDLWHYTIAKMVDACAAAGIKPFYGPFGDFSDPAACEAQFRNAFLMGCAGAWTLHPLASRDRQARVLARRRRGEVRAEDFGRDARRHRRRHDRRQDAGRRHLEAGQGGGRSGEDRGGEGCGDEGAVWGVRPSSAPIRSRSVFIRMSTPKSTRHFPEPRFPNQRTYGTGPLPCINAYDSRASPPNQLVNAQIFQNAHHRIHIPNRTFHL